MLHFNGHFGIARKETLLTTVCKKSSIKKSGLDRSGKLATGLIRQASDCWKCKVWLIFNDLAEVDVRTCVIKSNIIIFCAIGFFSDADTLESSSMLIYSH